ncbi:MAG TPA: hypothetical protein VN840_17535 [Streptosporangiaceae bacterium]|nr:hypothetical protein [Streptosporangiaceae bacterium]
MRHWFGFILALDLSAALFFGAGWGIWNIDAARGTPGAHLLSSVHGELAVAALVGTGLLLGILLAVPAVSPLSTGLPGLVLLGWSALVVLHSSYALRYLPLPASHFAAGFTVMLVNGVLALAGAAMIVPLLIPSRWRRRQRYEDEFDDDEIDVPAVLGLVP